MFKIKNLMLAALAVLVLSTPALAQAAPCDIASPTSGTITAGQPMTVSACHNSKDNNGAAIAITGWALYDGVTRSVPVMVADTVVSASGYRLYSVVLTAPAAASVHSYTLAAVSSLGEGARSAPFVLTVVLPVTVPAAPINLQAR